jgi:hypothetical protein
MSEVIPRITTMGLGSRWLITWGYGGVAVPVGIVWTESVCQAAPGGWAEGAAPATGWSEGTTPAATWTEGTQPATTWTEGTGPTTPWTET